MTISEIRDYLAKYCGEGKGDTIVKACYEKDNPITDGDCICDIVFIESKNEESMLVLQMG